MFGVSLLVVPYWWDRSFGSLCSTLQLRRPDLSALPFGAKPEILSWPDCKPAEPQQSTVLWKLMTIGYSYTRRNAAYWGTNLEIQCFAC